MRMGAPGRASENGSSYVVRAVHRGVCLLKTNGQCCVIDILFLLASAEPVRSCIALGSSPQLPRHRVSTPE